MRSVDAAAIISLTRRQLEQRGVDHSLAERQELQRLLVESARAGHR